MADDPTEIIGGVSIEIGADFSKLADDFNAAISQATTLASKFGTGIADAIGAGIGGVVFKQLLSSGALDGLIASIGGAVTAGFGRMDFTAAAASIQSAIRNAVSGAGGLFADLETAGVGAAANVGEAFSGMAATVARSATAAEAAIGGIGTSATATGTAAAEAGGGFATFWAGVGDAAGMSAGEAALGAIAIGAGAAAVAMTALIEATNAEITAQAILAAQSGTTWQDIATYQGADNTLGSGGTLASLFSGGGLQAALDRMAQLAQSSDAVGQALAGVFANGSTSNGIEAIVAGFEALPDPVDKARLAVELFGSNAGKALDLMNQKTVDAVNAANEMAQGYDQATRESMQRITDFANTDLLAGIIPNWRQDWAELKQIAVLAATGIEDSYHTAFVQLEADAHDLTSNLQQWLMGISEMMSGSPLQIPVNLALSIFGQSVPNLSDAQLSQYITNYLKGIQGEGSQPGTIAPPSGFDASKGPQQLVDSLVNLYAAYQQLGVKNWSELFTAGNSASGLSDMGAFVALANTGVLGLDRLSTAADTLKAKLESAFEDGAISAKQLEDALNTIYDAIYKANQAAAGGALSQNVAKPFSAQTAFGDSSGWAGYQAALASTLPLSEQFASGLAALNALLDQQSISAGGAAGDLDQLNKAADAAATSMEALISAVPGAQIIVPWQAVTQAIKEANKAAVDFANTQLSDSIAAQMYLIQHPDFTLAEKEWQSLGTVGTQVITALSTSISNDLGKALADLITGTKGVAAAFQQMGASILDSILKTVIGAALKPLLAELQQLAASTPGIGNFFNLLIPPTAGQIAGATGVGGYMGSGTFAGPLPAPGGEPGGSTGGVGSSLGAASSLGTSAIIALTAAVQANTAAQGAAVAAQYASTAQNIALGNVVQGTFSALPAEISTAVDSTFGPLTEETIAAMTEQSAAAGAETAAAGADAVAVGADTAAEVADTTAVAAQTAADISDTAALVADTAAVTAETAAAGASAAAGAAGGIGSALSGITGALGGLGAALGLGVSVASGIVQGDELAQLNNKMWTLVSSNQGILNQLISLQGSANQYWPQLVHLTDIWGAIVDLGTILNQDLQGFGGGGSSGGGPSAGQQVTSDNTAATRNNTEVTSSLKGGIDGLKGPVESITKNLSQQYNAPLGPPSIGQLSAVVAPVGSANAAVTSAIQALPGAIQENTAALAGIANGGASAASVFGPGATSFNGTAQQYQDFGASATKAMVAAEAQYYGQLQAQFEAAQTAAYNTRMAGYQANTDAVQKASDIYSTTGEVISAAALKAGDSIQRFSTSLSQYNGSTFAANDAALAQGYAAGASSSTGAQSLADISLSQGYTWLAQQQSAQQALYNATPESKYAASLAAIGQGGPPNPQSTFAAAPVNSNVEPISQNFYASSLATALVPSFDRITQAIQTSANKPVQVTVQTVNPLQAFTAGVRQVGVKS